jgi:hypothetical protein
MGPHSLASALVSSATQPLLAAYGTALMPPLRTQMMSWTTSTASSTSLPAPQWVETEHSR